MKKLKICHIITRFIKGGADENTLLTASGQVKKGHAVSLIFGKGYDKQMAARICRQGVEVVQMPLVHYNPFSAVPAFMFLVKFLREKKFDIVHTHSTEAGIVGRLAAKVAGMPCIVHTIHGCPHFHHKNFIIRRLTLLCERFVAQFTNAYIANSPTIAKKFVAKKIGDQKKYVTIRSGIDLSKFKVKKKKRIYPTVVCAARLVHGKGIETIIDAAPLVIQRFNNVRFIIAGDGPLRGNLKKLIEKKNVSKNIKLVGHREDLPTILSTASVFALPTYYEGEGTPRVITEAMAAGLPVISTPIAGIPDQITDNVNGFLILPNNPRLLAEKIIYVLSNLQIAKRMGKTGKERAKLFSSTKMVYQIDALYKRLYHKP